MIPQPFDQVPLLAGLSQEERELVTARLGRRQVSQAEIIFAAGEPSDALYIVVTGWVRLEDSSRRSAVIANLGPGSLVGEVDTLLGRPYSTSARASAPTQLQSLSRSDLQDLVSQDPGIGLSLSATLGTRIAFLEPYLIHQRLRNIPLLSSLSEDDLRALAQNFDFKALSRGESIVEAGSPADAAYLVENGHVRLISSSNEGEAYEDLKEGDLFGHTALVTGKPQPASARAIADTSLWVLPRSVYQDIIRQHPAVQVAFSRALASALGPSDQVQAIDRFRQLPFFSDVPTEALQAIVSRLILRHYPTNEVIYAEGTPGDALYIVESGEVKSLDSGSANARLLERVHAGDSFGEMALLTGRTRADCARAATDTTVWVLYKSDFDDLMVRYPEVSISLSRALTDRLGTLENDFLVRHLRHIHLLSNLATSELRAISNKVKGLRFRPGEIICFSGQPADTLYMIEMGEVKRFGVGMSGEPVLIDLLGPGESFGEQAIVQNSPYSATAQAIGELELWTISKNDFIALMEQFPSLAMTVTRMMADRLARSQSIPNVHPSPTVRQPRNVPPATRSGKGAPPATRPPIPPSYPRQGPALNVPRTQASPATPVTNPRIQRPPSGARPIQPLPQAPDGGRKTTPVVQPSASPTVTADKPRPPHKNELRVAPAPAHAAEHRVSAPPPPRSHPAHNDTAKTVPAAGVRRARGANPVVAELGNWAASLSPGAKIRGIALILLFMWIALIVVPATAISAFTSTMGGLQVPKPAATKTNTPSAKPVVGVVSTANVAGVQVAGNPKVAIAVATNTPVPPTPTRTRIPPTVAPTATRRPATPTPVPATAAPAIIAPQPTAQAQIIASLSPAFWDTRLGPGGLDRLENVRLVKANVPAGQKFWRAVSVKFEDVAESGNDRTIYVQIKDESGKRVDGKTLQVTSDSTGEVFADQPQEKPSADICDCNFNWPLWGDGYNVQIVGDLPSDKVAGMIMPLKRHVNYRIVFQLTTMP